MVGSIVMNYQQQAQRETMGSPSSMEKNHQKSSTTHFLCSNDDAVPATTTTTTPSAPIRVITFDLDNTLWCTTSTIGAAIAAVDKYWASQSIQPAVRIEVIMKELFAANKAKYAPLQGQKAASPSQFTQLRMDAMQHLLTQYHDVSPQQAAVLADEAFGVMSRARHEAIPQHLAIDVVETLQTLRCNINVLIGAITDGNANPDHVAALKPFFDFCIQAETVGVSKPDARIFHHAVRHVQQLLSASSALSSSNSVVGTQDLLAGWVHIGDDWAKDIVGAKQVGMRTIWCRELILASSSCNPCLALTAKDLSSWSSSSKSKTNTPPTSFKGTEVPACAADQVDAIVDRFADIASVLENWHVEQSQNY